MEKKEMYVAPEVEVLEVTVEKGFAGSDLNEDNNYGVDLGGGGI